MPFDDKVIWSEGMFIRAQHFQQSARSMERMLDGRVRSLRAYGWGLAELKLNRELLSIGRFAVEHATGVFEDGTPFVAPDSADDLVPLQLGENTRDTIIYLTLPITQPGSRESAGAEVDTLTRYTSTDIEVADSNSTEQAPPVSITVGKLRLRYALESSESAGLLRIGLARILEVRADNTVVLDDSYIPPALDARTSPVLTGLLTEIVGLLNHRGEAIASRLAAGNAGTAAELTDTLMLQTINRWQPVFTHLASIFCVHPETIFLNAVALASELATFTTPNHRPRPFPVYDHERLQMTFAPVIAAVRQSLSAVLDRGAFLIPLTEHRYGIRVATVSDRSIYSKYTFILAAQSDMSTEAMQRRLVGQIKMGPIEQIRELVNAALPGIALHALPVAPRQIPYHTGKAYFELDRTSAIWKQTGNSTGLAIHIAGEFPGLELELWAVKA
jgi:type VI secretion system protein ImpJ